MARKQLTDIDLNLNELQNAVEQNLATAPTVVREGLHYWNTTDKKLYIYDGTNWREQGKSYTFQNGLTESATGNIVTLDIASANNIGGVKIGTNIDVTSDGVISVKNASNSQKGLIQIATDAEITTGTETGKAVNPKQLSDAVKNKIELTNLSATAPIKYNNTTGVISADIDSAPTENSTKFVSSGGVYTELTKKVNANTAISAGKKCKISYDAKGLVTGGEDLEASDIPDLSATYIPNTQKGVAGGVATLGSDGKVPAGQLPSFVDDVVDAYIVSGSTALSSGWLSATSGGSALTPEAGKIYVVLTEGEYLNKTYRWSGTTYVEISASPAQATESVAGIAKIATTAQVNAGSDNTTIVTPSKLAGKLTSEASATRTLTNKTINADNNTISNLELDNFKSGVIQTTVRDTSNASDTALTTEKAVATKLATKCEKVVATNPALTVSGGICTWEVTHTLSSEDVIAIVKEVSSGEQVFPDVVYDSGKVTIKINASANITAGVYKVVIIG